MLRAEGDDAPVDGVDLGRATATDALQHRSGVGHVAHSGSELLSKPRGRGSTARAHGGNGISIHRPNAAPPHADRIADRDRFDHAPREHVAQAVVSDRLLHAEARHGRQSVDLVDEQLRELGAVDVIGDHELAGQDGAQQWFCHGDSGRLAAEGEPVRPGDGDATRAGEAHGEKSKADGDR